MYKFNLRLKMNFVRNSMSILIVVIISMLSCRIGNNNHTRKQDTTSVQTATKVFLNDSIINIILFDDVSINWNNVSGTIVNDSLLRKIDHDFGKIEIRLAEEIIDYRKTSARNCILKETMVVGDIVFILVKRFGRIPLLRQDDVALLPRNYTTGFFEELYRDRLGTSKRFKDFLLNRRKAS
jgi:hypothetical protein